MKLLKDMGLAAGIMVGIGVMVSVFRGLVWLVANYPFWGTMMGLALLYMLLLVLIRVFK